MTISTHRRYPSARVRNGFVLASAYAMSAMSFQATALSSLEERGSDLWKEAKIFTTYALNDHLSAMDIEIDVQQGVAVLSGRVESDIDRQLAEQLALGVEGINEVSNQIDIDPGVEPEVARGDWRRTVGDATVTARIKSRLLWNAVIDGLDLDVTTRDGRVSIEGTVDSAEEARLVEQIALSTDGVRSVSSRLLVAPARASNVTSTIDDVSARERNTLDRSLETTSDVVENTQQALSDSWITAKVETLLRIDRRFFSSEVDVSTKDKVVTLSGSVENQQRADELVQMVTHVRGVEKVRSELMIGKS